MDTNGLVQSDGASHQLSDFLRHEPVEHDVIRRLGQDLAQLRVDMAFAITRQQRIQEAVTALWGLAKPIESGCDCVPPTGYIVPADTLLTLQGLLG